ncbi:MAG: glycosyltransferase family 2 protein [Fimbriimonadaceae bacterium]|nr:glycosyltransferase family 2 protein [Fimbriimonadaceae bacterium]
MAIPVSVMILTKNEEANLPGCLESVAWCDDIHVFDSHSTDRTVEIAEAFGAKVTKRPFDNWAAHQNWGLANLPFAHKWVLYIDADERVTPELKDSISQAVEDPGDKVAFRIRRRDHFMGSWLKNVQTSPWYMRLFIPSKMRYERLVNPISIPDGTVSDLKGFLDHYPFSKGVTHWLERHNSYSTFEAKQIVQNREQNASFSVIKAFTEKDFHARRFHQKELFYRIPARPFAKFLILFVLKRGFLDGKAGFTYAILQSIYEYMIVLKVREMERERRTRALS